MQSWTYDAPTGVYKNHELSGKVRKAAIAQCKAMQFVDPIDGYGKKKGESITITRVSNIAVPTSDALLEEERIPEDSISISTQALSVAEHGRALPYTLYAETLSHFNLPEVIEGKLRDQMALSLDALAMAAFKSGMVKAIPTGVAALTMDTDGTPSSAGVANVNYYHMEQMRDYAHSTLNMAPYSDGDYMMLLATKGCRGIKTDPKFDDWNKYTNREAKMTGEIGKIEGIRIVEVNNTASLSGSKGTGSVLGEGVLFGADAVSMGTVVDPEIRMKVAGDYGRSLGIAWYGVYGFEQIWDDSATAGEARVIHLTSS